MAASAWLSTHFFAGRDTAALFDRSDRRAERLWDAATLAPIDHHMIVRELLSDEEWDWLDGYHERVVEEIGPELDDADLHWLELATRPLS